MKTPVKATTTTTTTNNNTTTTPAKTNTVNTWKRTRLWSQNTSVSLEEFAQSFNDSISINSGFSDLLGGSIQSSIKPFNSFENPKNDNIFTEPSKFGTRKESDLRKVSNIDDDDDNDDDEDVKEKKKNNYMNNSDSDMDEDDDDDDDDDLSEDDDDSSSSSSDDSSDDSSSNNKKKPTHGIRIAGKRKSKKKSKSSLYQLFEDSKDDSNSFSEYSIPTNKSNKNTMPIVSMKKFTSKNSSIYSTGYQNRTLSSYNAVPIQTEAVLTSISQASTPKYDSDEESLDEVVI